MIQPVKFYSGVFRDILQREYDTDDTHALEMWEQLIAEHPLPPDSADDGVWHAWGWKMTAWLDRLVDSGN
jgi:hypothetical protein